MLHLAFDELLGAMNRWRHKDVVSHTIRTCQTRSLGSQSVILDFEGLGCMMVYADRVGYEGVGFQGIGV